MIIRCDMCKFRDGKNNLVMIECNKCGLAVHRECYGFNLYTKRTFECWACQAVGRSFEIEDRDEFGRRKKILQESRPTKCALCTFSDGIHAMHPLYDRAGNGGRQIYSDGGLAWAHSLCAYILTQEAALFGCARDGYYEKNETEEEDLDIDDRTENSELIAETQESDDFEDDSVPTHHFVYVGLQNKKELYERKQMICFVCGVNDKPEGLLRFCVQCCANDEREFEGFRGKHGSLRKKESCFVAFHVGCARWGGSNPNNVKRVSYFPGDEKTEPVISMHCTLHAEEVDGLLQEKKKKERRQEELEEREKQELEERRQQVWKERRRQEQKQQNIARLGNGSLACTISVDLSERAGRIQDAMRKKEAMNRGKQYWERRLRSEHLTREQISEVWKKATTAFEVHTISLDFIQMIKMIKEAERKSAIKNRKRYWKTKLTPEQFSEVWKKVSENVFEYISIKRMPNLHQNSRDGSIQRAAPQADENQRHEARVREHQRVIARNLSNQNQRHPIVAVTQNGAAQEAARSRRGAKRKNTEQQSDSGDDCEFEFQDDLEADQFDWVEESFVSGSCDRPPNCNCCESCKNELLAPWTWPAPLPQPIDESGKTDHQNGSAEPQSFVSGLCHPLPKGCLCCKSDLLATDLHSSTDETDDKMSSSTGESD